jgi:O-antigen/teichoic acid export membrane protein
MTFARRLFSGTVQLTLSNAVVRLISIVTMPIMTVLLSPQAYGVASLVGTVISLVSVFALAGIDMSYSRAYHSTQPPSGAAVEQFCWRFAVLMALLSSAVAAVVWWFASSDSTELDQGMTVLIAIGIVVAVGNTMTQTRARLAGRYRAMALTIIAGGIIGPMVSIGIAAWWRQDALALLLPMLLGYLLSVLLLGFPSIATLWRPTVLARHEGTTLIKIGLAGVVTAPMYWLLSSSDRWLLQHYYGAEVVGVYSIGYSVAIVGMMVNNAVMSVWLPEAAREYEQDPELAKITLGRFMSRLVAAMAIIWLVVAAAGGDIIRLLANERFHAAADVVPYIAGGVFFYGVLHLANTCLLLAKKLNWAVWWWFAGGLLCILLNWALVPRLGAVGAAITQCVSFAAISIGILTSSQAVFRVQLEWIRLVLTVAILVTAGAHMVMPWHPSAIHSLLLKMPIGLVVATAVSWVMAPDWCARAYQYSHKRLSICTRKS